MKIIAFKVFERTDISFEKILEHIDCLPYKNRLRTISYSPLRIEKIKRENGNLFFLDFSKRRNSGPGKMLEDAPMEDFELKDGQGFGEETAALYDKDTSILVMQYNHYGPRISSISNYFFQFARELSGKTKQTDDGFNFSAITKREPADEMNVASIIKCLEFSIDVPDFSSESTMKNTSLSKFLDNNLVSGSDTLSVQIRASRKRGRSLAVQDIKSAARLLVKEQNIQTLKLKTQEDENSPTHVLDLLEARLTEEVNLTLGDQQRYPDVVRWTALKRAYYKWSEEGLLPSDTK
ncbi:DUF6731 family protein [Gluconobacter sp. Gdi]|uniref:DUF6731 family protein n=1 Tax=Gluconobacter sp. Gdi TaxID=2691888 RepID=UPI00176788DF|nr:DUF6731 family protein [Gluconobacter sp. Gdi]GFE96549.1 hypothetical protein DmGdi_16220 [Gluconobacter sp. Gdi]